jgi:omega-6 fatty acid desaturase (delta-12 desaturase)
VSDIGSFPTITKEHYLTLSKSDRFIYLAMRHPLNILFGYFTIFMYSFCFRSFVHSAKKHWDCGLALLLHFGFATLLLLKGGWQATFLTLIIPHFIACALGSYLFYVQHNFPGVVFRLHHHWQYDFAALKSTSYLTMNPIMTWFSGSIGLHHVHHLNSRIPFYRLREAMQGMPELQNPPTTTLKIKDIKSCLRLKVWDSTQSCMIDERELKTLL